MSDKKKISFVPPGDKITVKNGQEKPPSTIDKSNILKPPPKPKKS